MKKTQFIHVIRNVLLKLKHNWNSQPVAKKILWIISSFIVMYLK